MKNNKFIKTLKLTKRLSQKTIKSSESFKNHQDQTEYIQKVLRETEEELLKPLTTVFKQSLREGKLPKDWKLGNITALFKAGSKSKCENYRPISLTSIPGKCLEKIVRNAVVNHLEANDLLTSHQYGFRKGYSCTTQLLEALEDWTEALEEKKEVDILYIDLRRQPFDPGGGEWDFFEKKRLFPKNEKKKNCF